MADIDAAIREVVRSEIEAWVENSLDDVLNDIDWGDKLDYTIQSHIENVEFQDIVHDQLQNMDLSDYVNAEDAVARVLESNADSIAYDPDTYGCSTVRSIVKMLRTLIDRQLQARVPDEDRVREILRDEMTRGFEISVTVTPKELQLPNESVNGVGVDFAANAGVPV